MTASSFGPKNAPKFADADAPDVALNPTEVAVYAAKVGNRRVGTTAERTAATGLDLWEGLEWKDTTDGNTYTLASGVWVGGVTNVTDAAAWVTPATGWSVTSVQAVYTELTIQWRFAVSRTGSAIAAVAGSGNISNTPILTINADKAKFRPYLQAALSTQSTGPNSSFVVEASGVVEITATMPVSIDTGTSLVFGGTYIRAV